MYITPVRNRRQRRAIHLHVDPYFNWLLQDQYARIARRMRWPYYNGAPHTRAYTPSHAEPRALYSGMSADNIRDTIRHNLTSEYTSYYWQFGPHRPIPPHPDTF